MTTNHTAGAMLRSRCPDLDLEGARTVGVTAAEAAGALLVRRYRGTRTVTAKGAGDVVTDLDHAAEQLVLQHLEAAYPDHQILAEESGLHGSPGGGWTWLVDPLDGTNNVVIGLPAFVVGLALCHDGVPMVGIVHEPTTGCTWSAVRGRGVQGPGFGHGSRQRRPQRKGLTLGWTQGYTVGRDDPMARSLRLVLESNSYRLLQVWAPLLCWTMLARGDIDGMVGYRPETIDLPAGLLIAQEAGMRLRSLKGTYFDDRIAAGHGENGESGTAGHPGNGNGHVRDHSFVAGPHASIDWLVARVKDAMRLEPALTELWSGEDLVRPLIGNAGNGQHAG